MSDDEDVPDGTNSNELSSEADKIDESVDDELDEMLEAFDDDGQPIEGHEYWDDHEMPESNEEPEQNVNGVAERGYEYLEEQPDPVEEYGIDTDDVETIGEEELRNTVLPEDYRDLQSVAQALGIKPVNIKAEDLRDEVMEYDYDEVVWTVVGLQVSPGQESDDE